MRRRACLWRKHRARIQTLICIASVIFMLTASTVDPEYWVQKTQWYTPWLDAKAVAAILGVQETTVRQYAARGTEGFPIPASKDGIRNQWSPDQIYQFILTERPQLRDRIPRLYCPLTPMIPAIFLFAESQSVQRWEGQAQFVDIAVHRWQPSDTRGPIAVAYPPPLGEPAWRYAPKLLAQMPDVEAVAVVTAEIQPFSDRSGFQAALGVAQRGADAAALRLPWQSLHAKDVLENGWNDLANLLRQDVPWWSLNLRDMSDILNWRPGRPRQPVRPLGVGYNESVLRRLIPYSPAADTATLSNLIDRVNRLIEDPLEDSGLPTGVGEETPGLVQAAEASFQLQEVPADPTPQEMLWLLNRPVSDPTIANAAANVLPAVRTLETASAYVMRVCEPLDPLAREWLNRCIPAAKNDTAALGFSFPRQSVHNDEKIVRYLRHTLPDGSIDDTTWIIETDAKAFYVTVGTRVPASGTLTELAVDTTWGFFKDSTGAVWALPSSGYNRYYNSGYGGTGPKELLATIIALHTDAAGDVASARVDDDERRRPPLWRYITHTDPPLRIGAAHLAGIAK